jgi:hypothetical protein
MQAQRLQRAAVLALQTVLVDVYYRRSSIY